MGNISLKSFVVAHPLHIITSLSHLPQKCGEKKKNPHIVFIDLENAYDKVFMIFCLIDCLLALLLKVQFDITFPALPCSTLSLDAMDISGEQHLDVRHDILKKRIDANGNVIESRQDGLGAPQIEKPLQRHGGRLEHNETYCGSCYGAEVSDEDCCNSCEDVREAYRKKGWGLSNPDLIDQISHRINRLSFGDYFPGVVNPLDGVQWIQETPHGMYQYFIKVVPTVYTDIDGHTIQSNQLALAQFSMTEHFRSGVRGGQMHSLPGVFFFYDLSPIKVTYSEHHVAFLHFLTNVCAIIGEGNQEEDGTRCDEKVEKEGSRRFGSWWGGVELAFGIPLAVTVRIKMARHGGDAIRCDACLGFGRTSKFLIPKIKKKSKVG
ncbi:hypothetical protein ACLOJK_013270 [Asimina triloba]